jgi:predicted 2-oxoglutarate/Fe(II)-dependent dioxygenase YbiX
VGYFYEYGLGDYYRAHCDSQTVTVQEGLTMAFRKVSSSDVSSVLYLNDNFIGGDIEFVFPKAKVRPKAGRLLLFYGGWENAHCVHPVQAGHRYCIVNWYATQKNLVPNVEMIPSPYADYYAQLEKEYAAAK